MKSISPEARCLAVMRAQRATFFSGVLSRAREASPVIQSEDVKALQGEGVEQIAELLFLFRDLDLSDPKRLRAYLARHNSSILEQVRFLEASKRGYSDTGVSRDRLEGGIISGDQIEEIVAEAEDGVVRFDQSTFACLLVDVMSAETCRKLLILLSKFGFLKRTGRLNVRIRSNGRLEDLFKDYLSGIISAMPEEVDVQ